MEGGASQKIRIYYFIINLMNFIMLYIEFKKKKNYKTWIITNMVLVSEATVKNLKLTIVKLSNI
jgi:hypothetical protein